MSAREIGYFGEEGSFAHRAAARRFPGAPLRSFPLVEQAFAALGQVAQIVVPIENASSGIIPDTVDQLVSLLPGLAVRECLAMPIALALVAKRGGGVKVIYSHLAALTHARTWLAMQYPEARVVPVESTSVAARRALEEPGAAALAGDQTAELYGLEILRTDVQSGVPNRTKFYVVGKELSSPTDAPTHTALLCELPHHPGSLVNALSLIAAQGLNLTMIQSRPIPGRFNEYRFFLEYEGTKAAALDALRPAAASLSLLGRYPIVEIA